MELLAKELQMTKANANLHQYEAIALLEQLLHLEHNMGDLESHYLEAEERESKWKRNKESLDAEVECLRKELFDYKSREEGH